MKLLSHPKQPYPKLAVADKQLTDLAIRRMAEAELARPGIYLRWMLKDLIELIGDIIEWMPSSMDHGERDFRFSHRVLYFVEVLMIRIPALEEYLKHLLNLLLTDDSKSRSQALRTIGYRIEHGYQIPINKIKHNAFSLTFLLKSDDQTVVPGFTLWGPIHDGDTGPLAFSKKHSKGGHQPQGYSIPLFLRRTFALFFELTDIVYELLASRSDLLDATVETESATADGNLLNTTIRGMNELPAKGYPEELGQRFPLFELGTHSISTKTMKVQPLVSPVRVVSTIPTAVAGVGYKLPYWRPR